MVETRAQRRTREQLYQESYQRGLRAREEWFRNVRARMMTSRRWNKQYRPSDPYHRHRLEDDQPKEQRVVSYMRRI